MSSPLLYLLIAFAYLLVFSTGFFSESGEEAGKDELASNIINYETLDTGEVEHEADARLVHFMDFTEKTEIKQNDSTVQNDNSGANQLIALNYSPPTCSEHSSFAKYTSELFNRPPPAIVA